jgi:hypothetical protein
MLANPVAMMLPLIKPEIGVDDGVSMSESPGDIVGASDWVGTPARAPGIIAGA